MRLLPAQLDVTELDEAVAFLRDCEEVMLTSHINSDGDGIGGCLALAGLLRKLGKSPSIVLQDVPADAYSFLSDFDSIVQATTPPPRTFDRVVVLDCPAIERMGVATESIAEGAAILNLDHHVDNQRFGDVNIASNEVCSTCELVYHIAAHMGLEIEADTAEQLYTGIIFDTGTFRYSLTTPISMEVAAELVRRGARLDHIADRLYNNSTLGSVKVVGRAIESLQLHCDARFAILHLTTQDIQLGDPEAAVNYGLMVGGVEVTALLKEEQPGKFRISLRSREAVDVSALAHGFGGGGHARAAGCRLEGTAEEVKRQLHEAVGKALP
jgi:phosphoesterase RecJ-like protein